MADVDLTIGVSSEGVKAGLAENKAALDAFKREASAPMPRRGGGVPGVEDGEGGAFSNFFAGNAKKQIKGVQGLLGVGTGGGIVPIAIMAGVSKVIDHFHELDEAIRKAQVEYDAMRQKFGQELHFASLESLPALAKQASAELAKIAAESDAAAHRNNAFWNPARIAEEMFGESGDEKQKRLAEEDENARTRITQVLQKQVELGNQALEVDRLRLAGLDAEADKLEDKLKLQKESARITQEALHGGVGSAQARNELIAQAAEKIRMEREEKTQKKDAKEFDEADRREKAEMDRRAREDEHIAKKKEEDEKRAAADIQKTKERAGASAEALRLAKMTPTEKLADLKESQADALERFKKAAPGSLEDAQIQEEIMSRNVEIDKLEEGNHKEHRPTVIASSKAELGLGGGVMVFGGGGAEQGARQQTDYIRQILDAVKKHHPSATGTKHFKDNP